MACFQKTSLRVCSTLPLFVAFSLLLQYSAKGQGSGLLNGFNPNGAPFIDRPNSVQNEELRRNIADLYNKRGSAFQLIGVCMLLGVSFGMPGLCAATLCRALRASS